MATRRIETAELLAVGAELLVGDTQDTNSGDVARELTKLGVEVLRISALPDRLEVVAGALRDALAHADLVVTTGGLGPTPDDLTREAIAHGVRRDRRGSTRTSKPGSGACSTVAASATPRRTASRHGSSPAPPRCPTRTAPRPAGGSTGPTGGSSWRCPGRRARCDPCGATTSCRGWWPWPGRRPCRRDAAPLGHRRVAAGRRHRRGGPAPAQPGGRHVCPGRCRGRSGERRRRRAAGPPGSWSTSRWRSCCRRSVAYVFARGDEGWPAAIGRRLAGRTVAIAEVGTAGQLVALLGAEPWLVFDETLGPGRQRRRRHTPMRPDSLRHVRDAGRRGHRLCVRAVEADGDMQVTIAITDGSAPRSRSEPHSWAATRAGGAPPTWPAPSCGAGWRPSRTCRGLDHGN